MSCRYRTQRYRCSVTAGHPGTDPTAGWNRDAHPADMPVIRSSHQRFPSVPIVPLCVWTVIRSLLHSSHAPDHHHAVYGIIRLINDYRWIRFPHMTDDDIRRLWTVMWAMPEWDGMFSVIMFSMFIHATDDLRRWMWEQWCVSYGEASTSAVVTALIQGIPLWMLPQGIPFITDALRSDPMATMEAIRNLLDRWADVSDPVIRTHLSAFLSAWMTNHPPVWSDVHIDRRMWIELVQHIIRLDPTLSTRTPGLIDAILTACTDPDDEVSQTALTILEMVRPFDHPQFRSTMEKVLQRPRPPGTRSHVPTASLLIDSVCEQSDIATLHTIMTSVWKDATESSDPWVAWNEGTFVLFGVSLKRDIPGLLPDLRQFLRPSTFPTRRIIFEFRDTDPFGWSVTREMIDIAAYAFRGGDWKSAVDILIHAWGKGYDDTIVHVLQSYARKITDGHLRNTVLAPGLFLPQTAQQVIDLMTAIAPNTVAQDVIDAIRRWDRWEREGRRLAPEVLPIVIRWCLDHPNDVSLLELRMLWTIDPSSALSVGDQLLQSSSRRARKVVMSGMAEWWQDGGGDQVVALLRKHLDRILEDLDRREMVESMTGMMCNVVGFGEPDTILTLWRQLVWSCPSDHLETMASCMYHCSQLWGKIRGRGDPMTAIAMLICLYDRGISESDRGGMPIESMEKFFWHLIRSIGCGWGCGADTELLSALEGIVYEIMNREMSIIGGLRIIAPVFLVAHIGWGRGLDHRIGTMLLRVMDWLDHHDPRWYHSFVGDIAMTTLTSVETDPTRPYGYPFVSHGVSKRTITRARTALAHAVGRKRGRGTSGGSGRR